MKEFIKMFLATLLALTVAFVGGFLLVLILASAVTTMTEPQPVVKKGSILVFDMNATIQDSPVSYTEREVINEVLGNAGPKKYSLRSVLNAIESAGDDMRISGLYLKGSLDSSNYGSGYAALKEVREAIESFKKVSSKPVIAHLVYPSARDLYLATVADDIIMNPEGMFLTAGMASEPIFFAGFFKKYGIGVQVTKAGAYKSAAESFVLEQMSAPAREQAAALLEDIWDEFLRALSEKSDLSVAQVQNLMDKKGLIGAKDALEAGIVDELGFGDSVIRKLKNVSNEESEKLEYKSVDLSSYILATKSEAKGDHIAVLYAEGPIVMGEGGPGEVGGSGLAKEIRKLRQNEDVKAIVLRVNSPGGSALASEMIQYELRMAQKKMPVIVSMGTVAASGGYWISAYGDKIYAEPNTITGSIGVIGMFMNFKDIANRHGFTFDVVKTAKFADAFSPSRPKSAEEMAIIQEKVDEVYSEFLRKVVEGRKQPPAHIAKIAEGRVWSGEDALELGLVDEIGGLNKAIAYAAEKTGMEEDLPVLDYPKAKNFLEELRDSFNPATPMDSRNPAMSMVDSLMEEIKVIAQFNDPKGVYAILPYKLNAN